MGDIQKVEYTYPSSDGATTVYATIWYDADGGLEGAHPRGVVQLVHGMSEYIDRYNNFACFLVGEGFVVCGNDHVGHGRSVSSKLDWGHMDAKTGADTLVADVHALRLHMTDDLGIDAPYFLYGHSMGSFVARAYVSTHAEGLAGAVICGTGFVDPGTAKGGVALASVMAKLRGPKAYSKLVHDMADGAYAKAIKGARTGFDWLNTDDVSVDSYIEDEACGFMFTLGGYTSMFKLLAEVNSPACAQKVPHNLPLFYIAGSEDPVGNNGEGVRKAAKLALDSGSRFVDIKIYDGMRHEILNEPEHEQVYADVLAWLNGVIENR